MADSAGAAAGFLALGNCVVQPIKRQLNYLCCFSRNIHDFGGEKKKLVTVKDELQMRVTAALDNAEIIVPEVETWLKDADEIQEKIIGIESEITNIQGGSCLAVRSRYSLIKKIKKPTEAMKELRNKCRFDLISERTKRAPPPATVPLPLGSTTEFESRRQIEDDIMTCLKAGKVNMLGICGMGGVGKTTMAKRVMNKARAHHLFGEIVIVVVSQPADMFKVQTEIAESLGLKLDEETLPERAHKLRIRLMSGKRILIILDDVWMSLNLEDLGIPRESGSKGCTILLTSRVRDVLSEMEAHKIFGISTLSNEEAWSLFSEKAGVYADDPNLLSIAQEIVDKCKGLPIAIVNIAAELKDKNDKHNWDDTLQQLRSGNPVDMPKFLEDVYKPLKLSYDFLGSQNAQSIFLLCCLFPEDSRIHVEDLIAYVWGLRMFEGDMDLEEVRNMTYSLVQMLKSHFLLLEVDNQDEDYVRMHDVVRDVAIFIASKEKQLIKCGANCTWLSLYLEQEMEDISNGMDFQNLRLLMTDGSVSDISFEGMRDLNVLFMRSVPSLPRTTQLLKSLRTLILESWSLKSISGIGELVDLEILICRYASIEELPVEMSGLVRLMKLEISYCRELRTIAPTIISSLVALKEFKMENSFKGWEAKGRERENAALSELECLSSLTCLSIEIEDPTLAAQHMVLPLHQIVKYDIVIGKVDVPFPDHRREFEKTMLMCLPGEITSLGNWVLECISRVEYLFLEGAGSNIVDLGQTQKMRMLIFRDCSTTRKLVNISIGSTTVFPYLEYLELEGLGNLEEICHIDGQIPKGSPINAFKNLKELLINGLPMLKHLWENSSTYQARLPQLEKLEISTCEMMEQILLWNEEEEKEISFPQLKRLILRNLPRLTSFSKGIERIEFPQLTDMTIDNCPLLRSLFPITNATGEKVIFGMLKNLQLTNNNTALKLWCHQIPLNSFNELERLYIRNFSSMRSLFSSSTARNLGNLKTLRIHDCEEMVNVVDNEEICEETSGLVFPRLQQLEMWGLHKLEIFCRYSLELPLLREMHILDCSNIERFSLGSLTTPNLEVFKVGFRNITIKPGQDLNVVPYEQSLLEAKEEEHSFFNWVLKIKGMERLSELYLTLTTRHNFILKIEDYTLATEQINFPSDIILRYHITIGNVSERVYPVFDRTMRLHLPISDEITLGNWVHQCVRNVEFMCLEGEGSNKVDLQQAQNMRRLTLKNSSTLTKLVNIKATSPIDDDGGNSSSTATTTRVFPHLEDLNLEKLPNLEEIFPVDDDGLVPASIINNVFYNLKELRLQDLPRLKHLWKSSNANPCLLQQLQTLFIMGCPMMEQVFLWENQGNDKEEAESEITIPFPELKSLELYDLPMLTTLCKGIEIIEFPQLTNMMIFNCPQLKSLLASGNNLFCQPKKVAIGGLKDLHIWGNESISNSSSLWCDQIPTHGFFTGIEKLRICYFSKLRSLFSSSIASNLNNLRELEVYECREMVKVIEDDDREKDASCELSIIRLFPLLHHLWIYRLPKLEIFCEWRSCVVVELPSLKTVKIHGCPKMERFNLGSLITPNLDRIKIDGTYVHNTKDLNFILQKQVSRVEARECSGDFEDPETEDETSECSGDSEDPETEDETKETENAKGRSGLHLKIEDLEPHFGKRLKHVADELGVGRSTIKRVLRENGPPRWPNQKYKKNKASEVARDSLQNTQPSSSSNHPSSDMPLQQNVPQPNTGITQNLNTRAEAEQKDFSFDNVHHADAASYEEDIFSEDVDFFAAGRPSRELSVKPVLGSISSAALSEVCEGEEQSSPGKEKPKFSVKDEDSIDDGRLKDPRHHKHFQRCIEHCTLFLPDCEFEKEKLVQMWISEDCIVFEGTKRMEDVANSYFDALVNEEVIVPSTFDHLYRRMKYRVDAAKASTRPFNEGHYVRIDAGNSAEICEVVLHLTWQYKTLDRALSAALKNLKQLRTLVMIEEDCSGLIKQLPNDIFLGLKLLRTLDLSRTHLSELPGSIGVLESLRFLDISETPVKQLPESMDRLSLLQTLKLKDCFGLSALPRGLGRLINLRHLDLDVVSQLKSMPRGMGNLKQLQTLQAFLVGKNDGCGIMELKNMNEITGSFCISNLENVRNAEEAKAAALGDKNHIETLELRWNNHVNEDCQDTTEILEYLRPHFQLRELQLTFYRGSKLPSWISNPSFTELSSITLDNCINCDILPSIGELPSLKSLHIVDMNSVKNINALFCRNGTQGFNAFPWLEKLIIDNMLNLEEWSGLEDGDFPRLRHFAIRYCPKLHLLPSLSHLVSLQHLEICHCAQLISLPEGLLPGSLESLIIRGCPEINERCTKDEGPDWSKIASVQNIWIDFDKISDTPPILVASPDKETVNKLD